MLSRHICTALALQPRRFIHSTPLFLNSKPEHNSDSYNKDVDSTPSSDSSIHRVDTTSELAQKPHEAPSGEWSRAGTRTSEYSQPYAAPGEDRRYGGTEMYSKEKGPETSKREDGPEGKASSGRKPEGR